jgi:hypothetical protein
LNAEKEALFQISRRFVRGDEARVIKIRSTPAALVGYFTAANADDAIKRAIARDQRSAYAIQVGRAEGARDCHMIKGDPDINDGKASEAGKAYSLEVLGNAGKALRRSLM